MKNKQSTPYKEPFTVAFIFLIIYAFLIMWLIYKGSISNQLLELKTEHYDKAVKHNMKLTTENGQLKTVCIELNQIVNDNCRRKKSDELQNRIIKLGTKN